MVLDVWDKRICRVVINGSNSNSLLDLNRLRYLGFPKTEIIKGNKAAFANRDSLVIKLFDSMNESDYSEASLHSYYSTTLKKYSEVCDATGVQLFSEGSIGVYEDFLFEQFNRGEIKNSTYTREITDLTRLFRFLDLPNSWFLDVRVLGANQRESFEAYSQADLKKMLPILRGIFKQLSMQFLKSPKKYLTTNTRITKFIFKWEGREFQVYGGITKMMGAATYLLSYYTWCNSTVIYNLPRPQMAAHTLGKSWHSMPAFKRRSFKTITVHIGEHELEIPKYSMQFFDKLLEVSKAIDPRNGALLISTYIDGFIKPMTSNRLANSVKEFLATHFRLSDDRGRPLHPVISRFRETGSKLTLAHEGDVEAAILLDNTPNTVKQNYSKGNEFENNKMISEAVSVFATKITDNSSIEEAKEKEKKKLGVEVLTYDEYVNQKIKPKRNANGSYCSGNCGTKADKFSRKIKKHNLSMGKKLVCADLLACFECDHQTIVESEIDIWCLLSFKECVEESKYNHIDVRHFEKNFRTVLDKIESILKSIKAKVLRAAKTRLNRDGRHPLWQAADDINLTGGF